MRAKKIVGIFLLAVICFIISRDSVLVRRCNISIIEANKDQLISVYHNGIDVLDEYVAGEKHFSDIIEEKIGEAEFKDVDVQFCHFNDNLHNMTAEFIYNGKNYCLLMYNGEVKGLEKIEVKVD